MNMHQENAMEIVELGRHHSQSGKLARKIFLSAYSSQHTFSILDLKRFDSGNIEKVLSFIRIMTEHSGTVDSLVGNEIVDYVKKHQ